MMLLLLNTTSSLILTPTHGVMNRFLKGPFINTVRINGGRGVTQVRTNENKGEGGIKSGNVYKYMPKFFRVITIKALSFYLQNFVVMYCFETIEK